MAMQVCLNLVTTRKICLSLNITSQGHDIISRPQKLIWRYRELTSLATAYHHVPMASYVLAMKNLCEPRTAPPWHLYLCVGSPKKNQCFNSACFFCLSHHAEYEFILCAALQISHNNVSYSLDVALAYISYKAHHSSSQFGDTDAIPYIVITEESNINICFILYTSTIRTKCYELLL